MKNDCQMCGATRRRAKVVQLREKGLTFEEIGRRLGASRQAIHRAWKKGLRDEEQASVQD